MNLLDSMILAVNPRAGLERLRARTAAAALMNYDAASQTTRGNNLKSRHSSADTAAAKRGIVADRAQDLIRNTPVGHRAVECLTSNTIGDGIIPKIAGNLPETTLIKVREVIGKHFDTVAIDAAGVHNLYGLQKVAFRAIVGDGDVLIRRRRREKRDKLPLPFQIEVMEGAMLDTGHDMQPTAGGSYVKGGIQFNAIGQREGYWVFYDHPGEANLNIQATVSRFIPADEIIHAFRADRPGQTRGVSWLAPVALNIRDMADYQDADIVGKKVAAAFAGFVTGGQSDAEATEDLTSISPGRLQYLRDGEGIEFTSPPKSEGFPGFMKFQLQMVAAGIGSTYESLSGDFSTATFSSARMGRIEFDRNISQWQWLMLIPQMMDRIAAWTIEALALVNPEAATNLKITWVPPTRVLVDPAKEIQADAAEVAAGFASRQGKIRSRGYDPEEILKEQIEDKQRADEAGLAFTTSAAMPPSAPDQGNNGATNAQ